VKKLEKTTIQVSKTTKERLRKLGVKGESWDTVLNRLLDIAEKKGKGEDN